MLGSIIAQLSVLGFMDKAIRNFLSLAIHAAVMYLEIASTNVA